MHEPLQMQSMWPLWDVTTHDESDHLYQCTSICTIIDLYHSEANHSWPGPDLGGPGPYV